MELLLFFWITTGKRSELREPMALFRSLGSMRQDTGRLTMGVVLLNWKMLRVIRWKRKVHPAILCSGRWSVKTVILYFIWVMEKLLKCRNGKDHRSDWRLRKWHISIGANPGPLHLLAVAWIKILLRYVRLRAVGQLRQGIHRPPMAK